MRLTEVGRTQHNNVTATVGMQTLCADHHMTYFGYLSHVGQMPTYVKALIDRYHIRIYDDHICDWRPPIDAVNCSANNNDDDAEPVQSPAAGQESSSPSPAKLFKLRVPSLTRRLKLGKRSSTDKNKAEAAESVTSPSDSQLETPSSMLMMTAEDLDNQKNKCEAAGI